MSQIIFLIPAILRIHNIEHILLEYHKAMGNDWKHTIVEVDEFTTASIEIRSVCISSVHIQFYEQMDLENKASTVFWKVDVVNSMM